jgi:hypothetical protein
VTATARFWREFPARYNLIGVHCENCNQTYFPPRGICPNCTRKSLGKMRSRRLSGEGEVFSYTVVHDPHPEYEMQVPYVMALVKTTEGVNLLAQVVDCDPKDVEVGKQVKVCFRKLRQEGESGIIHYGFKFKLAE